MTHSFVISLHRFTKAGNAMRSFVCTLLFLYTSLPSAAQKIEPHWQPENLDSLKQLLVASHDTAHINLLNELSYAYYYIQMDSSKHYALEAQEEASAIHYGKGEVISLFYLGQWHLMMGDFGQAKETVERAFEAGKSAGDKRSFAYACILLGLLSSPKDGKALEAKADSILKSLHDAQGLLDNYAAKGITYMQAGESYNALKVYNDYIKLARTTNDVESYANGLQLIGRIYNMVGDYATGNNYLKQSIVYRLKGSHQGINGWDEVCYSYQQLKKYDSALLASKQMVSNIEAIIKDPILRNRKLEGALIQQAEIYINLQQHGKALSILLPMLKANDQNSYLRFLTAQAYKGEKKYDSALRHAYIVWRESVNNKEGLKSTAGLLSEIYHAQGRNDSAYHYLKLFADLKDSLATTSIENNMAFFKTMNQKETAETQVALLNKEAQLKQQRLNLFLIGSLAILLLGAFAIYFINLKRKNETTRRALAENELQIQKLASEGKEALLRQRAAELEMQSLRAQMNPHFIFNCLNAINHFILNNEAETASDYLTRFSRLIRMVLQNASQKEVLLGDELTTLRLYIELEQVRFKKGFKYQISVAKEIDAEALLLPPMLLQPFVENAIWHGLMHKKEEGFLLLELFLRQNLLFATITDNGVGRSNRLADSQALANKKSMGMQITADRLMMAGDGTNGSFTIVDLKDAANKPCGTKVMLQIPVSSI